MGQVAARPGQDQVTGRRGTDHERTWIVSKLRTSPPQARAALIRYIGRRWGAVQANRLDASTVMLDLTAHELKLFKAQRPHPLLLQTVLEINEPG